LKNDLIRQLSIAALILRAWPKPFLLACKAEEVKQQKFTPKSGGMHYGVLFMQTSWQRFFSWLSASSDYELGQTPN
jgi:hypothetical protein